MNNLNNISEYQKIIFANGLDESNINYTDGIEGLSKKYPFVVFITKQSDKTRIDGGESYEIDNIWFEGIRLTKFVGIDNTHNTLTVGDHTLKLKFDPVTGLIGIYDENELASLTIESISWNNDINSVNSPYQTTISSLNNKFSIIFKYVLNESNNNLNSNIENINKALSFIPIDAFEKVGEESVQTVSNLIQYYKFTYKIKKPYYSFQDFSFISNYANDKSCNTQLKLYLHPESYAITMRDENNNVITSNGSTYNLKENTQYSLSLSFTPLVDSNQLYHQLYTELTIGDQFDIDAIQKEIKNGIVNYTITTPDVNPNSQLITELGILIKFVTPNESNNEGYYSNLNKTLTFNIAGETTDKFFYFGYDDPRLETTQYIDYSSKDIGNYIWEDTEIGNNQSDESWYADKYFYCAIPVTYSDVLPRWYAYNHESTESSDCVDDGTINHSNPLDCITWFDTISSRYTRNGIDFKIYKHKVKGKFYGFIK